MQKVSRSVNTNIKEIKKYFSDSADLVVDTFSGGPFLMIKYALMYFDGMSDKIYLSEEVKKPLSELKPFSMHGHELIRTSFDKIRSTDKKKEYSQPDILSALNRGDGVLFIENCSYAVVIASRATPKRNISEPQAKTVIRGAHDGFTENFRDNTALLRNKLKSNRLVIEQLVMGDYTQTSVGVCYLSDLVEPETVNSVKEKLECISLKSVLESGFIQNELEKGEYSLFPLSEATERSDEAAIAILQGRVVVIVENTPFVLVLPGLLKSMLTSAEDYNESRHKQKIFLALRALALVTTLVLPAAYIAIVQYNPEFVSVKLISFIIYSRKYVPFPAFMEILFVEFIFEAIIEAGIRLPKQIGATVSIVGTIAIGQGLVEANLVNMIVVVIVAFTAVLVFVIPNYSLAVSVRILKFFFMTAAAAAGFFGIIVFTLICLAKICDTEFFGIEYLAGIVEGGNIPRNVKKEGKV